MASNEVPLNLDARKTAQKSGATIEVRVKFRNTWKIHLGLAIVSFGAWIAGLGIEVQDDQQALAAIVEQLRSCQYECEAGTLAHNVAFQALEEIAKR